MTLTSFSSGVNTSFSSELNTTFGLAGNHLVSSSLSASSVNSSTYSQIGTHSISGGEVTNHVWIMIDYLSSNRVSAALNANYLEVKVDGVQVIERIIQQHTVGSDNEVIRNQGNVWCYFEPSAGQISGGFTITINGKSTEVGSINNYVQHNASYVIGA